MSSAWDSDWIQKEAVMSYRTFFLLIFLVNTAAFAQANVVTFEPTDTDPEVTIYNIDTGDVDVVNLKSYLSTTPANMVYYDPRTVYPNAITMTGMVTGNSNAILTTDTYVYDYGNGYVYNGWYGWTVSKQNMGWNPNWSADEKSAVAYGYGTYELAAAPGLGVDSDAYAVCYVDIYNTAGFSTLDFATPSDLEKIFVTNTTLTAANIEVGNTFSTAFNKEGDHFSLTIKGFTLDDQYNHVYSPDMTVNVNLTQFRNGKLDLTDYWKEVNLSSFVGVDGLDFFLETSDVSEWGPNTPYYFAIDSLSFASPGQYYIAQDSLSEQQWTIDGDNKSGIMFTDPDSASATYPGEVKMNADGSVTVGDKHNLTLSGDLSGEGNLTKTGSGTLTLSENNNDFSGKMLIQNGTLALTDDAVNTNNSIELSNGAELEYNVEDNAEKTLDFTTGSSTVFGGNVLKTGKGKLKITANTSQFTSDEFFVEAGELQFSGEYNGNLIVGSGATFSPGESQGTLTVIGDVVFETGSIALFEFGAFNNDPDNQEYDTLSIAGDNLLTLGPGTIVLSFLNDEDASLWAAADESGYMLVAKEGFASAITNMSSYLGNYRDLFALEGRPDGLFLVRFDAGDSGVPEPSTLALLVLGMVGMTTIRRNFTLKK